MDLAPRRTRVDWMPGKTQEIEDRDRRLRAMHAKQTGVDAMARVLGVTPTTVYQALKRLGLRVARRRSVLPGRHAVKDSRVAPIETA